MNSSLSTLVSNKAARSAEGAQAGASPSDIGAIVQVASHMESGPIARFALELAQSVHQFGGDSRIISAGGRFALEAQKAGLKHQTLPMEAEAGFGIGGPAGRLTSTLNEWNTRLVHSYGETPSFHTRKAVAKSGRSHIASLYRLPSLRGGKLSSKTQSVLGADRLIVGSQYIADQLSDRLPEVEAKIRVICPGLSINAIHPSVVTASRLTRLVKRIDIPIDTPIVLFPAALQPSAGHKKLLDVLEAMRDTNWLCVWATIGPADKRLQGELMTKVAKMGLANRIKIVENCDDPATLYKLSSVVISSIEGHLPFDYAAAEAQAAGKIVLVPNSGSSAEQVLGGTNGAQFESGDAETLHMALSWALTLAPDTKASIEHAATAYAYKTYKKEEVIKRVFAVYDDLLVGA